MGLTDEEIAYKEQTVLSASEQKKMDRICDLIRMNFISKWSLNSNVDLYKTDTERDWAYIVRREYRYNVNMGSFFASMAIVSLFHSLAIWKNKKMVTWPYVFLPLVAPGIAPYIFKANSRRYFEMLNVGTEFELGAERNRVLEECNRLAHRADF